jgi:Caspase domain
MGATYAVLVAVEKYEQPTIEGVNFAAADAEAMRDVLIQQFQVPPENIQLWKNQFATRSAFEEDLKYHLSNLSPDDRFIFFYAGHAFYKGGNRLTAWDTRTVNILGTTVCLDQILLTPLKNSPCQKSLVFVDACASTFGDANARDLLQDMKKEEFEAFVQSTEYCAAFFSCSPGQRSYSSKKVQHGIWTYHLLRAFLGQEPTAFERDRCITGDSLHNFLTLSVPSFIAKQTDIKEQQRPYAVLSSNGPIEILHILEGSRPADQDARVDEVRAALGRTTPSRRPNLQLRPNGAQRAFQAPLDNTWARISLNLSNEEYELPTPAHNVRASMAFVQPGIGIRAIRVQQCFFLIGGKLQPTVGSLHKNEPCEVILAYTSDGKTFRAASSHSPSKIAEHHNLEAALWRCKVTVQSNEASVSGVFELMLRDDRPIEIRPISEYIWDEVSGGSHYHCNFCAGRFESEEEVKSHLARCGC